MRSDVQAFLLGLALILAAVTIALLALSIR